MTIIDIRATLPRSPEFDAGSSEGRTSVTVHWEGGAVPTSGELADEHEHLKRVARFHIEKDWSPEIPGAQHGGGLMYELVVGRSGNVYRCRDPLSVLWHSGRATANALSIPVLVLCGPGQPPTPEQLQALAALLADLKQPTFPHQHWSSTECPGPELLAWLAAPRDEDLARAWTLREQRAYQADVLATFEAVKAFVHGLRDELKAKGLLDDVQQERLRMLEERILSR